MNEQPSPFAPRCCYHSCVFLNGCPNGCKGRLSIQSHSGDTNFGAEASLSTTLSQRGTTHGDFGDNATFALQMRDLLRSMKPHYSDLPAEQRLALDEIALKIARIVSGGHYEVEHWHDIQGYAKLAEKCAASRNETQK